MTRFIKNTILRVMCIFISVFYRLNRKKIFFRAYNGLRYACNPRAISEKMHEMDPSMEIVWSMNDVNNVADIPDYVRVVKKKSFAEYRELFTSKFWVLNAGLVVPCKRKGQLYMDTWHGDRAFKNVDKTSDGSSLLSEAYKHVDVILSGSDYGDEIIRRSLNPNAEILHCGSPRNDMLFQDNAFKVESIRKVLNLERFDKILTYAPTFRGNGLAADLLDFSYLADELEKRDGKKWAVLIRQHHKVKMQPEWKNDSRIVDASKYPEMQDLLLISDMVISDYSSLVGDFVLLNRPVVLYVPDLDDYKSSRGLNFDLEKSPFKYAKNAKDLFQIILDFKESDAAENCKKILDFYGRVCENGNASEQACQWILDRV